MISCILTPKIIYKTVRDHICSDVLCCIVV
jgi:hypothetical protein